MTPADDIHPSPAEAAFKAMRRAPEGTETQLTTEGQALMSSLDESVRPKELAARYPRIVNQFARQWRTPTQMDKYFQDLLIDTRGNRQGFPLKIVMELSTLREHYTGMSGSARAAVGAWDGSQSLFERHR
jgi:hypothetical protein